MIPRLYEYNDTAWTSYGICPLTDAVSCFVTEELNGEYYLEMEYPRTGQFANELIVDRVILADPHDGATRPQPFRIVEVLFDMVGNLQITANHISYQLADIIIGNGTVTFSTPSAMWNGLTALRAGGTNPFTFQTDVVGGGSTIILQLTTPRGLRSNLGGENGCMLDWFNGEFEFDRYVVNFLQSRGSDRGVKIAYSKNLTGLTYDINMDECVSAVLAYWQKDSAYVQNAQSVTNSYAYNHFEIADASNDFETQPTTAQLREWAQNWLSEHATGPSLSLDVQFVPLWQTEEYRNYYGLEHVALGDTVTVEYPPLNINVKSKVVRTVYNVLSDRYMEMSISTVRKSLADTIVQLMEKS